MFTLLDQLLTVDMPISRGVSSVGTIRQKPRWHVALINIQSEALMVPRQDVRRHNVQGQNVCSSGRFVPPDVMSPRMLLSRPLLDWCLENIGFVYPACLRMMVIGSSASYTKTKSVESAVWCLLTLDDDVENRYFFLYIQRVLEVVAGSKYLNTVQDQNCSFSLLNNNKTSKDSMKMKTKQIIEQRTKYCKWTINNK